MGVLRHIGERCPDRCFPILTGVSAGAINIAYLASHTGNFAEATAGLAEHWSRLTTRQIFRSDPFSVARIAVRWILALASGGSRLGPDARSLVDTRPLRSFLERAVDASGIEENIARERLRAVAISATSYQTGRTISFVQGGERVELWERPQRRAVHGRITIDHVMASSALPLLFPAVAVDGSYYGDGSIRQPAPLSPAIHLGANRILSVSARYDRSVREAEVPVLERYPPPAQVVGLLFNNIFLDTLDADAARLERINRLLERCTEEERPPPENLRPVDLHVVRPSLDLGALAAEYRDRLPRMVRFLVGGLDASETRSSDFVSYLLFEPAYLRRLMETGRRDAEEQWPEISAFLGWNDPS